MNRNRKNSNRGFTLVELLATIVILGVLSVMAITNVSRLVEKSRTEQRTQQEKSIAMAAESYLQSNTEKRPKTVGESTKISVKELKKSGYLKEDVKDSSGQSCMDKSYVKTYRITKTEYTYTTFVYCGNEKVDPEETIANPNIEICFIDKYAELNQKISSFTDDAAIENSNICAEFSAKKDFSDVSDAGIYYKISGGTTPTGTKLQVDGFELSLSAKDPVTNQTQELYSSGNTQVNRKEVVQGIRKISEYVDITKANELTAVISARNVAGGVSQVNTSTSGSDTASYKDKDKPYCSRITEQGTSSTWINKYNYSGNGRKIQAECEDGQGSGCIRSTFTQTWPNSNQKSAKFSYIQVKDNAGNTNIDSSLLSKNPCELEYIEDSCLVGVFLDIEEPKISLDGYVRTATGNKSGSSILTGTKSSEGATNDTVNITSDQYKDLTSGWMNGSKYENGVIYTVTITDNLELASYQWETNPINVKSKTEGTYTRYSSANEDGLPMVAIKSPGDKVNCGVMKREFTIGFTGEGMRKGRLTVKDRAGNITTYYIEANLDRTAPPMPTPSFETVDGLTYTAGNWSTKKLRTYVNPSQEVDNNNSAKVDLSGFSKFQYSYEKQNGKGTWANAVVVDKNGSLANLKYDIPDEGTHKLKYKSCDKAGNCTAFSNEFIVRIDTKAPTCGTNISYSGTLQNGWLGKGESATVTHTCTEVNVPYGSGCDNGSELNKQSKVYNTEINTTKAGAVGDGNPGQIKDIAGNISNCENQFQTVKIDTTEPKCTLKTTYPQGGADGKWIGIGKTAVVSKVCTEQGGVQSGCDNNATINKASHTYNPNNDTWNYSDAGPEGKKSGGQIQDLAGNVANCPANQHIMIDHQAPSFDCTFTHTYNKNTDNSGKVTIGTISPTTGDSYTKYYGLGEGWKTTATNEGKRNNYMVCGKKTYEGKAKVVDQAGNETSKTCGSYTTPGGCDKVIYKDGKKCGGGTKNQLAYSAYKKGMRCSSSDKSSGGSKCNTQSCCSTSNTKGCPVVYDCRCQTEIHSSASVSAPTVGTFGQYSPSCQTEAFYVVQDKGTWIYGKSAGGVIGWVLKSCTNSTGSFCGSSTCKN